MPYSLEEQTYFMQEALKEAENPYRKLKSPLAVSLSRMVRLLVVGTMRVKRVTKPLCTLK